MYNFQHLNSLSEKQLSELMVHEHAYLKENVAEYDRETMIEILLEVPAL